MYNFNVDDECGDTVIILNIMNLFLLTTMVLQIGKWSSIIFPMYRIMILVVIPIK